MAGAPPAEDGSGAGRWTATVIGVVGIVLWASETALARFTLGLPPLEIVGLAFLAATLLSPVAWWLTGDSPLLGFRQPAAAWLLYVPSLVCYHACIYYAVQRAPAAPAALLQGCTPLFIVLGSAFLPGARLRWWHLAGVTAGFEGLVGLSLEGRSLTGISSDASWFLAMIGLAAGLWGIYSLVGSRLSAVPTSVMGLFYAASAALALSCNALFETWVMPTPPQAAAIAALGLLPMGLALFCWDFGMKRGDVRSLGVMSYVEPLIGAGLVVLLGQDDLRWSMLISGIVIIGGAVVGSADLLEEAAAKLEAVPPTPAQVSQRGRTDPDTALRKARAVEGRGTRPLRPAAAPRIAARAELVHTMARLSMLIERRIEGSRSTCGSLQQARRDDRVRAAGEPQRV